MPEKIKVWRYASTSNPSAPPLRLARGAWDDRASESCASDTEYIRGDIVEALTAECDALKAVQIDAIRAALEAAAECCVETAKEALDDHTLTAWLSGLASEIRALDPAAIAASLKGDGHDR